jgi:phosphatidylinositol alpha-1,6-mannosyltransferase
MPELNKTKLLIIGPNNVKGFNRILLNILPKKASVYLATLMGYTTDYHVAQSAIKKNKLSNDVHFLGGIKFNQMVNILRQSNLMIMPNIPFHGDKEGFGLVILEANISGKYVLGANIEGITSAIHDEYNGSLLESKDATEWVNTINRLKENKTELQDKGIKAKQYVLENFGWDKMVFEYEKFFQQILS